MNGGLTVDEKPFIGDVYEHVGGTAPPNRGGWQKVRCVLHDDSEPSATLNLDEGIFHCFVCSKSLDSYGLLMWFHGIDFKEAKDLARKLDLEWRPTGRPEQSGGLLRRTNGQRDSGLSRGSGNQPRGRKFRPSWKSL